MLPAVGRNTCDHVHQNRFAGAIPAMMPQFPLDTSTLISLAATTAPKVFQQITNFRMTFDLVMTYFLQSGNQAQIHQAEENDGEGMSPRQSAAMPVVSSNT